MIGEKRDQSLEFSFCVDPFICSYSLREKGNAIVLRGEERRGGYPVFSQVLEVPREEKERAAAFFHALAESETFPRMMMELAEEFFI